MADNDPKPLNRREFLRYGLAGAAALTFGGIGGRALTQSKPNATRWQIDPSLCVQCEKCATECVLTPSAVKCFHAFNMCGYCDWCFGYFQSDAKERSTAAENQLCPTGALVRRYVEEPYYQYVIDEPLCIGCGICVKGCNNFGNGSLFLQIDQSLCVHCNDCAIARQCPAGAIVRVDDAHPYLLKGKTRPGSVE